MKTKITYHDAIQILKNELTKEHAKLYPTDWGDKLDKVNHLVYALKILQQSSKKIICKTVRMWENDLPRWRGYVILNGVKTQCLYMRTTKKQAMQDAKDLKNKIL